MAGSSVSAAACGEQSRTACGERSRTAARPIARAAVPAADHTTRGLWYIVLAGMITLAVAAGAGLMDASAAGWITLILWSLGLWVCWLYWRAAEGEAGVPGHVLQPFLAVTIIILLGHILAGGSVDPDNGRINLLAESDSGLLIRVMTLSLLILLAQDILSRVRNMRWLLTGVGLTVAVAALLKLNTESPGGGVEAVVLSGFAGIGMLLTPCCLPASATGRHLSRRGARLLQVELVLRITLAAALAALLIISHDRAAEAAAVTACAVAGALLLAGLFLRQHRLRLLVAGAILSLGGTIGVSQLGFAPGEWIRGTTLFGTGGLDANLLSDEMTGIGVLGVSAGWVGFAAVACGMLAALLWSLYVSRNAAAGDQARCAVWSAVIVVAGCALMAGGGLALPVVTVVAAVTWGLMPHVMAHPVRRYRGWAVPAAFFAALVVLGLESRVARSPWLRPVLAGRSDTMMHFLGAFGLTAVLLWQRRCRTWPRAALWAAVGGTVAALGELAQKYLSTRSPQWSDVGWDLLGAAAALAIFGLIYAARRIEQIFSAGLKVSFEKYYPPHLHSNSREPAALK